MAGKSGTFANKLLRLIFFGTAIPQIADNAASTPATNFYVALHTADPGETGLQNTNEVTYTGYAREVVSRTAAGWLITTGAAVDVVNPNGNIDFAPRTDVGSTVATYFSIGMLGSGAGEILYFGPLNPSITITQGVTPRIGTTSSITEA